eukprot:11196960-Lingulodinium_polyedra.AAC.1
MHQRASGRASGRAGEQASERALLSRCMQRPLLRCLPFVEGRVPTYIQAASYVCKCTSCHSAFINSQIGIRASRSQFAQ